MQDTAKAVITYLTHKGVINVHTGEIDLSKLEPIREEAEGNEGK